jgi:hypothetical protein
MGQASSLRVAAPARAAGPFVATPPLAVKLLVAVWVAVVALGAVSLWRYKLTPGKSAATPAFWPAESALSHLPGRATLVMFAHPRCPCTRASLAELKRVLTPLAGQVTAEVVFMHAHGADEDWSRTETLERAQSIPGVQVAFDDGGREAARFGVTTSGHVVLYDREGRLSFSGGITPARNHEGDSPGRQQLGAALSREVRNGSAMRLGPGSPVFGCALAEAPR